MRSTSATLLPHFMGGAQLLMIVSGSFRPLPVQMHTTRSSLSMTPSARSFLRPATDAADAGSTQTPSLLPRSCWAAMISSSVTVVQ